MILSSLGIFLLRDGSFFMSVEKSFDSMNKTAKNKFENNR